MRDVFAIETIGGEPDLPIRRERKRLQMGGFGALIALDGKAPIVAVHLLPPMNFQRTKRYPLLGIFPHGRHPEKDY